MNRYVLALGTNCEPRLEHLREGLSKISQFSKLIKISPIFENAPLLPPNAPESWYQFFLNTAVLIESSLSAQELLKKCQTVETETGRPLNREKWAPRTLDIDLIFELSVDDTPVLCETDDLRLPHSDWKNRNFVLAPLLHLLPSSRLAPEILKHHRDKKTPLTAWMPILNVTPDSFSENNTETTPDSKLEKFKALLKQNPAVIDIGAESTRPGAAAVSADDEWFRLESVLTFWRENQKQFPFTQISLDTRHPKTAQRARDFGVSLLNDVSGLISPEMCEAAEHYDQVIFMHSLTVPADPKVILPPSTHPTEIVLRWAQEKKNSLTPMLQKKLIFDPGIGFGKTPRHSLQILQNIEALYALELPLLVGHSRKSFMNLWSKESFFKRDHETLGVSAFLYGKVEFLRIHNLDAHQKMVQSLLALGGPL